MTEGKMAYYKVVRLVKELDDLLQIPLILLNIKKLQAKLFIEKVGEILRMLEMEVTTTLPEQEVDMILSLALPIEDFPEQSWLRTLRSSNEEYISNIDDPWIVLGEVPEIVQQINFIMETQLEKFLDDTDFYNKWEDLRNNLGLVPIRQTVRNLLQASQELKEAMTFFHEVGSETNVLCQYLKFLLTLLEESRFSNEFHGNQELVRVIRDVVNKAHRALNCPKYRYTRPQIGTFLRFQYESAVVEKNCSTEEKAKNILEGMNGLRLVLLGTLRKLDSFKGYISMICEKLGREDFQSWNAPISISQPWCPSVSALPSAEERKGKERKGKHSRRKQSKSDIIVFSHLKSSPEKWRSL